MSVVPKDRSLLILFSVIVLDLIGFGIVVPILPFYAEQFGANGTILGFLLTSYSGMQFLFSSFWGRLSDRIGRKPILISTMAGSCIALLLLGFANSLILIFAARLLGGIFAANISVASAYVADVTSEENRSKGMGLIGAAFGIGFILGPALGGLLAPQGYNIPIFAAALLTSINILYATARLREPPRHPHHREGEIRKSVLADRTILFFCLLYFIFTLSVTQLESVFAFYMMDRFAYDAMHVAYILAMMALIMVAIQGGAIRALTERFGERVLLITGTALLSLSFFFIPQSATLLLLLPLCFASVGRGISQPSLLSLVSKSATAHRQGAVMGTFQASASLGRVIGPVFAGFLYDQSPAAPFYLAAGLMVVAIVMSYSLTLAKPDATTPIGQMTHTN